MTASEDGLVAIFGPPSLTTGAMVQSVCSNLEIPQIQISWKANLPFQHQTILNIYPDHDLLAQAYATIVRHTDWRSYAILYETNEGLSQLNEVLKLANPKSDPVIIRQLDTQPGADHRYNLTF